MQDSDPQHEDRVLYAIVALAFWVIGALALGAYLLNQGQGNWATGVVAIGLALAVYCWFGRGRIADLVRFPGRIVAAMFATGTTLP